MRQSIEISIELAARELLAPPSPAGTVEVDDICAVDPKLRTQAHAGDEVEIELTPEQIDALLRGKF